ncbi:MAG: Dabb family protein, partial [Granulosicoccus sp.]
RQCDSATVRQCDSATVRQCDSATVRQFGSAIVRSVEPTNWLILGYVRCKLLSIKPMILHTVAFKLHHPNGSDAESDFLLAASKLSSLPGVLDFRVYRQVGVKNNFTFGLSMEFENQQDYDGYNNHPEHQQFVNEIWLKQVEEFMELDYVRHSV